MRLLAAMATETLKKYLTDGNVDARHVMTALLNGIAATAIRDDSGEYEKFVAALDGIAEAASNTFEIEALVAAAGSGIEALDAYNRRIKTLLQRQAAELQKVIGMLADTVIAIGGSDERSAHALEEIQGNLAHANGLQDLASIKERLGACLEQVCRESARRKEETRRTIAALENQIREAEAHLKLREDRDPVTELKGRATAERTLREACSQPGRKYVAVVVLDSLRTVNARFGPAVGDRVLAELARHVESRLQPGDALFRWSGPSLLALLPRQCTIDRMRDELRPILGKPIQKDFDIGGRDVLIPISPAWAVFGLVPPPATILKHIDTFMASQAPKDYV